MYSREKSKISKYEEENLLNQRKIEKCEKKIIELKDFKEKFQNLEKQNEEMKNNIEKLIQDKGQIEKKYRSFTMEVEKVF